MRTFKQVDLWISTGLIISFIIINIIQHLISNHQEALVNIYLLAGYFVVGGWQVISMIIHAATKTFTHRWRTRYIYHWITFISVITMPGSFWVLIFTAPFMAVFYTGLCFSEVRKINQRPLSILK